MSHNSAMANPITKRFFENRAIDEKSFRANIGPRDEKSQLGHGGKAMKERDEGVGGAAQGEDDGHPIMGDGGQPDVLSPAG